jgi:class 3 adenylate cyclase
MSRKSSPVSTVRRIVVVFDICSSTKILEDLLSTENERRWRNLLIGLKKELVAQSKVLPFEIYKFVGDGWILLFEDGTKGREILEVLKMVSVKYHWLYHHGICAVLGITDHLIGLTFGIESGTLVQIVMNQKREYIGRALNVASRLQSAVKDCDRNPSDKLLISKNAYARLKLGGSKATEGSLAYCTLRNVAGGQRQQVRKITVFDAQPSNKTHPIKRTKTKAKRK